MSLQTDDHGEYRVLYRFVDRWTDCVAGWAVMEVREYMPIKVAALGDGGGTWHTPMRVVPADGGVTYDRDVAYEAGGAELMVLADIYRRASEALGARRP